MALELKIKRSGSVFRSFTIGACVFFFSSNSAHALERDLHRSLEAAAMGGAYTAIAEDEMAIFLNPAGVAAYDAMEIHWLSFDMSVSDDLISSGQELSKLRNVDGSTINSLMGKNIYMDTNARFMLMSPNFGFASFYNIQLGAFAKNQALPDIELAQQQTAGFQAAFGFSTSSSKKRGKGRHNRDFMSEWRFGVAPKYVFRRGGIREVPVANLITLSSGAINDLFGAVGSGYGVDLGVQRVAKLTPTSTLRLGAAYLDVGDTRFNSTADPMKSRLNTGIALTWRREKNATSLTGSMDFQQINNTGDFQNKLHMGLKLGLPVIDLFVGLGQMNFSYGLALDLWILRLSAASYVEEIGPLQGQNPDRRYGFRLDMKFKF